jgi:hypothetical protein
MSSSRAAHSRQTVRVIIHRHSVILFKDFGGLLILCEVTGYESNCLIPKEARFSSYSMVNANRVSESKTKTAHVQYPLLACVLRDQEAFL